MCFNNSRAIILVPCWLGVCVQPAVLDGLFSLESWFLYEKKTGFQKDEGFTERKRGKQKWVMLLVSRSPLHSRPSCRKALYSLHPCPQQQTAVSMPVTAGCLEWWGGHGIACFEGLLAHVISCLGLDVHLEIQRCFHYFRDNSQAP